MVACSTKCGVSYSVSPKLIYLHLVTELFHKDLFLFTYFNNVFIILAQHINSFPYQIYTDYDTRS